MRSTAHLLDFVLCRCVCYRVVRFCQSVPYAGSAMLAAHKVKLASCDHLHDLMCLPDRQNRALSRLCCFVCRAGDAGKSLLDMLQGCDNMTNVYARLTDSWPLPLLAVVAVCRAGDAGKSLLDKLQGYDYDPDAEYPEDSISQIGDDELRVRLKQSTPRTYYTRMLQQLDTVQQAQLSTIGRLTTWC